MVILIYVKWYLIVVLICISIIISIYMSIAISMCFLENCLFFKSFTHFRIMLFFFLSQVVAILYVAFILFSYENFIVLVLMFGS